MADVERLLEERGKTHGPWSVQSKLFIDMLALARQAPGWATMPPFAQAAITVILLKISRILCGKATEPDHWDDIAGYATLGKGDTE